MLRSSIFWDVTKRRLVVSYRRFETNPESHFPAWPLKTGPIGCLEKSLTTNLRFVTSHKSEDVIYTATKD